jgi:hypothetical protein
MYLLSADQRTPCVHLLGHACVLGAAAQPTLGSGTRNLACKGPGPHSNSTGFGVAALLQPRLAPRARPVNGRASASKAWPKSCTPHFATTRGKPDTTLPSDAKGTPR